MLGHPPAASRFRSALRPREGVAVVCWVLLCLPKGWPFSGATLPPTNMGLCKKANFPRGKSSFYRGLFTSMLAGGRVTVFFLLQKGCSRVSKSTLFLTIEAQGVFQKEPLPIPKRFYDWEVVRGSSPQMCLSHKRCPNSKGLDPLQTQRVKLSATIHGPPPPKIHPLEEARDAGLLFSQTRHRVQEKQSHAPFLASKKISLTTSHVAQTNESQSKPGIKMVYPELCFKN